MSFYDKTPAQWAAEASEALRATNHTTRSGLEFPSDAYDTVAALAETAARMPQALDQINAYLTAQERARALRSDRNSLAHDLAQTRDALSDGALLAKRLFTRLDDATQALAHLGATDF